MVCVIYETNAKDPANYRPNIDRILGPLRESQSWGRLGLGNVTPENTKWTDSDESSPSRWDACAIKMLYNQCFE